MEFLAHISEDRENVQTVKKHLEGTADLAQQFGASFGAGDEAFYVGMLHDIGKFSVEFQNHLLRDGIGCDHSTAGAQQALKAEPGNLPAAFAIAGHHGGLPDGGSGSDRANDPTLMGRRQRKLCDYSAFASEITAPRSPPLPLWINDGPPSTSLFRLAFYIRMLYSCLVDADFLDTERFMSGGAVKRGIAVSPEEMLRRLDGFLHRKHWDEPRRELDKVRWEILTRCRGFGREKPGLFTLTVPTGGGKAGASMGFVLEHAAANHLSRIIYVIPYTSIIEQNAAVFREMLGDECILEHHSGVDTDPSEETTDPLAQRRRLATENWDSPVIVTTAVQFFESLFAAKSSRCRKLHNLANSVIIFDEAQMMPVPYLRPCVASMTELAAHYGCSAVLCTATQPSLLPLIQEYAPTLQPRELCPNVKELIPKFRRVNFCREETIPDDVLAERLNRENQVLCIVNSRRHAQSLYDRLQGDGRFHLSTLMTPEHRRRKLEEICRRLRDGERCRVISTSLIEAGVDVDFPTVYRAEAGLDSVLQAAGRCNREGRRPVEESTVHIFRAEGGAPPLFRQNIAAADTALRQFPQPDDPAAVHAYFSALYQWKGSDLDRKHIMEQWAAGAQGVAYPFRIVADEFHLIEQPTTPIYIPTKENGPLLEQLRQSSFSRGLFRKLGQSAVAVYPQHLQALDSGGYLEWVDREIAILRTPELYTEETGLQTEPETGQALFG